MDYLVTETRDWADAEGKARQHVVTFKVREMFPLTDKADRKLLLKSWDKGIVTNGRHRYFIGTEVIAEHGRPEGAWAFNAAGSVHMVGQAYPEQRWEAA